MITRFLLPPNINLASALTSLLETKVLPLVVEKIDGASLDIDTSSLDASTYFGTNKLSRLEALCHASNLSTLQIASKISDIERNRSILKIQETSIKEISAKELKQGDILVAIKKGGTYLHYGVYVGNGEVVHFSFHKGEKIRDTRIIKTTIEEFANGSSMYREPIREGMAPNNGKDTARIAENMVDNKFGGYNLLRNNCEHFANYCKYNQKESFQITELIDRFAFNYTQDAVVEHYINNNYIIPHKYEKIKL